MGEPNGEIPQYIKKPDVTNIPEKKDYLKTIMDSTRSVLDKIRGELSGHTHPHSENIWQKPAGTPIEGEVSTSTATLGVETGLSASGQPLPRIETTPQSQNLWQKPAGTPIEGEVSTSASGAEHLRLPLTLKTLWKQGDKSENKPAFETTPQSQNVWQKPEGTPIEGSTSTNTATLGVETGLSAGGQALPNVQGPTPPPLPTNLP